MKAPPVIHERIIDTNHLLRHLCTVSIERKFGGEVRKRTTLRARRTKGAVLNHKPTRTADLPHRERLTVGEQDPLRVSECTRECRPRNQQDETRVHHKRESVRASESVSVHDLATRSFWVGTRARLPSARAHLLRNASCGVFALFGGECGGELHGAAPSERRVEETPRLLHTTARCDGADLRQPVERADGDGDGEENQHRRKPRCGEDAEESEPLKDVYEWSQGGLVECA